MSSNVVARRLFYSLPISSLPFTPLHACLIDNPGVSGDDVDKEKLSALRKIYSLRPLGNSAKVL